MYNISRYRSETARIKACGDCRPRGRCSRKLIGFRQWFCCSAGFVWGINPHPWEFYKEEYARIDERCREILKGGGSFIREKERQMFRCNIT